MGFTGAFTSILTIAAVIAIVGAAFAFALVRSRDFVSSVQPEAPPEAAPVQVAAG